jgi:acyl carrier protein
VLDDVIALIRGEMRGEVPIDPDTRVLSSGLVDSFRLAVLLSALQTRYQVRIPLPEIGADNFDTPRQMVAFIQRQQR